MNPDPAPFEPLARQLALMGRSVVDGARRAVLEGGQQLVAWQLKLPEGASRVRQFVHGLWLPVVVARAVLADRRVRNRWLRYGAVQAVATALLAGLVLSTCGDDGAVTEHPAVISASEEAVDYLREAVKARTAELERGSPGERELIRAERKLIEERLTRVEDRVESRGKQGPLLPGELSIQLSRALDDAALERAAAERARFAGAVERIDGEKLKQAVQQRLMEGLAGLGREAEKLAAAPEAARSPESARGVEKAAAAPEAARSPESARGVEKAAVVSEAALLPGSARGVEKAAVVPEAARSPEPARGVEKAAAAPEPPRPPELARLPPPPAPTPEEEDGEGGGLEVEPEVVAQFLEKVAGPAPAISPEQMARAREVRAELRRVALAGAPEAEARIESARPWMSYLATLGGPWQFFAWLVAVWGTLYAVQLVVIALFRDYHSELSREACLLVGIAPEDTPVEPHARIDWKWIGTRVKRRLRGWWVVALGIPLFWLIGLLFPGNAVRNLLFFSWLAYWQVVFAASKSARAWVDETVAPPPWFVRGWRWLMASLSPVRRLGGGTYGEIVERSTRSLYAPAECVEQQPAAFTGLALFRLVGSVPIVKCFARPLIPVASALLLEAYRELHPARTALAATTGTPAVPELAPAAPGPA